MRNFLFTIIITFFLLVPELSAENNNRVVAFVNDDLITLYELNNKIEETTGKTCEELQSANEQEFFNIRKAILEQMINEKLANEKIKELELTPTPGQVDNYIENIKEYNKWTQEDLVAQLQKEGLSFEKFREKLKADLANRNLIDVEVREKTVITEEQIEEYYNSHKKEYERPGRVHIASIYLVPDPSNNLDELKKKGEDLLKRLQKGEDFADLAREFSNGPGANEGGDLGNIPLTDVDPKIMEVINSLKEGETSSLIDMGNRFQIIKLIKKTETEWVPLEDVKTDISELLYNEKTKARFDNYMQELRKNNYIKIIL